jgi:hypothetical protein
MPYVDCEAQFIILYSSFKKILHSSLKKIHISVFPRDVVTFRVISVVSVLSDEMN